MWIWIPSLRTRRTLLLYDVAENCFLIRICTQPIFYWISNREIWYLGNIKIRYQGSYNLWNDCIKCRLVCSPLQIPKAFFNYKIISYWSRICGRYKCIIFFLGNVYLFAIAWFWVAFMSSSTYLIVFCQFMEALDSTEVWTWRLIGGLAFQFNWSISRFLAGKHAQKTKSENWSRRVRDREGVRLRKSIRIINFIINIFI